MVRSRSINHHARVVITTLTVLVDAASPCYRVRCASIRRIAACMKHTVKPVQS